MNELSREDTIRLDEWSRGYSRGAADARAARDEEIAAWCQEQVISDAYKNDPEPNAWNRALEMVIAELRSGRVPGAAKHKVLAQAWALLDGDEVVDVALIESDPRLVGATRPVLVDLVRRGDA